MAEPGLPMLALFTERSMINTGVEFNLFFAWRKEHENCLRNGPLGHHTTRNDCFFTITGNTCMAELGVQRSNGWKDGQTWWKLRMFSKKTTKLL